RLDGEKMSKSRGNLVFVSRLLADGHDPMAVRLAIIWHPYRADWDWTPTALTEAAERLERWRSAVAAAGAGVDAGPGARVLAAIRERLADDLDARGAMAAVDEWASDAVAGRVPGSGDLVGKAVDALLGVAL
ncbi:MAG: cysteine--1-D-myo-inosityl 2-amino-2-deoxy-alpha-D-glucopyranoside ligase, partial [Actinobacteria bacterium]|nr:cysteine--1-D-myo-inosityl 2-amino-2-deoxy-alpha-D-glucopyranoside ligase [Actinomycetota bacterium]